jgi:1,2-diacylglycerol 3-alpha-glucosyltransferase
MKIIFLTDTFLPQINGLITSVANFSRELEKRGHEIYIFTAGTEGREKIKLGQNIGIKYFRSFSFFINYPDFVLARPNILKTRKEINAIDPDIIHIHTPSLQAWSAYFAAKRRKIPVVSTYHTLLPEFIKHSNLDKLFRDDAAKKITWWYTRKFYNKMDMVIAPSKAMKQELVNNGITRPVEVVSNGINTEKFHPERTGDEKIRLLHLGRISYEKNIDVILRAFKKALADNNGLTMTIAGGGPDLEKLSDYADKLGLRNSVKFIGAVSHEKVENVYNQHDIFVTASTIETEGLVILEAMSCGLPVVGVDKLAVPEIVKHGQSGYIAKPGNEDEIAKYILKLAGSEKLRADFSNVAISISGKYALGNSIDKIEKIYHSLLEKKPVGAGA